MSDDKKQKGKFKHYGSQTSKETLRRSGKYIPPEKPNLFNNIPTIYKPYYLLEKRVLEPVDAWIKRQASISILTQLAILAAIVAFIGGENVRRNNEVFAAWQTITSAQGQSGSGGRIEALQFLNSRPWRFPWIGWTEKGWYWDEQEKKCKRKRLVGLRWERQPLVGLSAPEAYLAEIHLCEANLMEANLQQAILDGANLQQANLRGANLQRANLRVTNVRKVILEGENPQKARFTNLQQANLRGANLQQAYLLLANLQRADLRGANLQQAVLITAPKLTREQVKSACNWEEAIYEVEWGKWNFVEDLVVAEPDNTKFIEKLKKDKSSDPEEPVDCSRWKK